MILQSRVDHGDAAHGAHGPADIDHRRRNRDDHDEVGVRVRLDHPAQVRAQGLAAQRLVGDHQNGSHARHPSDGPGPYQPHERGDRRAKRNTPARARIPSASNAANAWFTPDDRTAMNEGAP